MHETVRLPVALNLSSTYITRLVSSQVKELKHERIAPLHRCLPKMSPSSSTSIGSQIATWRRSLTWTRREFSFDLQSLLTGKIFVWLQRFTLNPVQRDILPHRQSQLSDLTIRLHITTSLKSISQKRWLYHQYSNGQQTPNNVTWPAPNPLFQ